MNVHSLPGSGVVRTAHGLRLMNLAARDRYTNAQIDDYTALARRAFLWRPPVRIQLVARFSHDGHALHGTAGFGFWNDPFLMTGGRVPALPRALWFFFASPPSNLPLADRVPGHGWKASTIDAAQPRAWRWAATAPCLPLLLRRAAWYRRLWPRVQRDLGVAEAMLAVSMTEWHEYSIAWNTDATSFAIDGQTVLHAPAPGSPLGLVIWIDNQWMVATPTGRFGQGVLPISTVQWLEIADLRLT